MLFQVYGENALYQWLGWAIVFIGLILINEVARRTKAGGVFCFIVLPVALTAYFVAISIGAGIGQQWALDNPTHVHMNSWFHYAKLYAATIGCIGFMAIKYSWGAIGKAHWFKCFPFVIVAINILIAVVSDFESAIRAWGTTWVSSEGVTLYGGWHNVFNGVAGIINIACMTGWFGIYISKKRQDMLWPDMTWVFIIAYDLWNFCYTYNCLPTHSWVLRPCTAAGAHRGQLLLEQGRLDPESRQYIGHLVHVRAGIPDVPGLLRVLHPVREQPEREPCGVPNRASGQRVGTRLHPAASPRSRASTRGPRKSSRAPKTTSRPSLAPMHRSWWRRPHPLHATS